MTFIPAHIYRLKLSGSEFKLLTAFYELSDPYGRVRVDKQTLVETTGISLATLTRSFRKLEEAGLLGTTRKRKGRNYFAENSYQLLIAPDGNSFPPAPTAEPFAWSSALTEVKVAVETPSLKSDDAQQSPSLTNEQSTGDHVNLKVVMTTSQIGREETDLLRKSLSPEQCSVDENLNVNVPEVQVQSKPVTPKRRSLSTAAKSNPIRRINDPRDARTRNLRPAQTWNTYDVAAEFCARVNLLRPDLPPLVNAKKVSGALMKMRKELGIGPAEELYLVDRFISRNSGFGRNHLVSQPEKILGVFLNTFKTELDDARRYGAEKLERKAEERDRLLFPAKWAEHDRAKQEKAQREREQRRLENEQANAHAEVEKARMIDAKRLEEAVAAEQRTEDRALRQVRLDLEKHEALMKKLESVESVEPVERKFMKMTPEQERAYWQEQLEILRSIPIQK